jgi:two-component system response regulator DesR
MATAVDPAIEPATPAPPRVKVGLVDDRAAARRDLRALLDCGDDLQVVVGPVEPAHTGPAGADELPDVLVLELYRPGPESIDAIRLLSQTAPSVRIVVLCFELNPEFARRVLDAGVLGYVLTDCAEHELPAAVRAAADGSRFVSARVASGLAALDDADSRLSRRELEVLRLTALGFTGTEIASQLGLSRRTVESHRATIHRKLGLASRAELVREALRRGLVGV